MISLGRKWTSEDILGSIQFYAFLCAWNFLVDVCTPLLYIAWHCACQCRGTKINGTTMWGLGLEDILLVSIVKHTGDSVIVSSMIFPRVFIHIGMEFTSDR